MYIKDIVKNKNNLIITVVVLIFFFLLMIAILDAITFIPYSIIKQCFVFVYIFLVTYYVVRYMLTCFSYAIINKQLIIRRSLAKKTDVLFDKQLEDIILIGRYKNKKIRKYCSSVLIDNMSVNPFKSKSWIIVYKENKHLKKLRFEPDEKMINVLRKSIENKFID